MIMGFALLLFIDRCSPVSLAVRVSICLCCLTSVLCAEGTHLCAALGCLGPPYRSKFHHSRRPRSRDGTRTSSKKSGPQAVAQTDRDSPSSPSSRGQTSNNQVLNGRIFYPMGRRRRSWYAPRISNPYARPPHSNDVTSVAVRTLLDRTAGESIAALRTFRRWTGPLSQAVCFLPPPDTAGNNAAVHQIAKEELERCVCILSRGFAVT